MKAWAVASGREGHEDHPSSVPISAFAVRTTPVLAPRATACPARPSPTAIFDAIPRACGPRQFGQEAGILSSLPNSACLHAHGMVHSRITDNVGRSGRTTRQTGSSHMREPCPPYSRARTAAEADSPIGHRSSPSIAHPRIGASRRGYHKGPAEPADRSAPRRPGIGKGKTISRDLHEEQRLGKEETRSRSRRGRVGTATGAGRAPTYLALGRIRRPRASARECATDHHRPRRTRKRGEEVGRTSA